jgi:leucyl aminopeptidase
LTLPITFTDYPSPSNSSKTFQYIDKLYPSLSTSVMRTILEKFTSFRTRYYRSQTGAESEHWLFAKVREVRGASLYPHLFDVDC